MRRLRRRLRLTTPLVLKGYALPPGTLLAPSIYLTHHRADLYPAAAVFRPECFLERTFTAWEYLPFGVGMRKCLGLAFAFYAMKMVLFTILSHFQPQLEDHQRIVPRRRPFNVEPRGAYG